MLRFIGIICFIISLFIIISNVLVNRDNEREMEESPFITLLVGGANLRDCYDFRPPLSTYEKGVCILGGVGLLLILIGQPKKEKEE